MSKILSDPRFVAKDATAVNQSASKQENTRVTGYSFERIKPSPSTAEASGGFQQSRMLGTSDTVGRSALLQSPAFTQPPTKPAALEDTGMHYSEEDDGVDLHKRLKDGVNTFSEQFSEEILTLKMNKGQYAARPDQFVDETESDKFKTWWRNKFTAGQQ